jgi:hypothetical protein
MVKYSVDLSEQKSLREYIKQRIFFSNLANQKPIENKVLAVLYQLSFMKSDSFQEL